MQKAQVYPQQPLRLSRGRRPLWLQKDKDWLQKNGKQRLHAERFVEQSAVGQACLCGAQSAMEGGGLHLI